MGLLQVTDVLTAIACCWCRTKQFVEAILLII